MRGGKIMITAMGYSNSGKTRSAWGEGKEVTGLVHHALDKHFEVRVVEESK